MTAPTINESGWPGHRIQFVARSYTGARRAICTCGLASTWRASREQAVADLARRHMEPRP